jgi:hypothetical protein
MEPRFVHGALSRWNRKGPSPNCGHTVGSIESSRMSYAVALRFPLTGTKGPVPWKTASDYYSSSTKLYRWHYVLGHVAFSWHPPNPDGTPESDGGEVYTTPADAIGIAHGDLRQLLCWHCFQWQFGTREWVLQPRTDYFKRYALQDSAFPFCELVWPTTSWLSYCCS